LSVLLGHERETGKVQNRNKHSPDIIYDIGSFRQGTPTTGAGVFILVSGAYLIEGRDDDGDTEEYVEVILYWTASEEGFWLEQMDDVAEEDLGDVEDEKCQPNARVRTVEMRTTTAGDESNSESPASDDEGTSNVKLDSLMELEPGVGRISEVTSD